MDEEEREPTIEDYNPPSDEEVEARVVRFNDMVASGMAEEDAYAVLADEHNLSDGVIAPRYGRRIGFCEMRKMRQARFLLRRE